MKKTITLALIMLLAVVLLMVWVAQPQRRQAVTEEKILLLVTDDDTGWFFLQLREGAQAACQSQGALLRTLVVAEDTLDMRLQQTPADAALLIVETEHLRDKAQQSLQDKLIPYRVIYDGGEGTIHMDEKMGAQQLARIIPANHSLVTVYHRQDATIYERMQGAMDYMGERPPVRVSPGDPLPSSLHFARACLALDRESTQYIVSAKEQGLLPASLMVFCYDTVETRVKDLESGAVYAMLMPEPYTLGYNGALAAMVSQLRPAPIGRVVTRRTMYQSRNVRLVFPLMQTD